MAYLMVNRGADGFWIGLVSWRAVIEGGGDGVLDFDHEIVTELIELIGGHARLHMGGDEIEHLGGKSSRQAHGRDICLRFDAYGHKV